MKKILLLLSCLILALPLYADGLQYLNHCKSLYNSGRYEEAKHGFTICKVYDDIDNAALDAWISKCEKKIELKRQAAKQDAQKKLEEREANKYVVISTDARALTSNYSCFQSAIKGNLKQLRFVKLEDDAKWGIYITANARKYNNPDGLFVAYVDCIVQVVDLVSGVVLFEQYYSQKGGHAKSYEDAAKNAYGKLIPIVSNDIKEVIRP